MVITMMMDTSSTVTSTSFKIKDLLLRAWRERWTEIEWGREIKRLLRGVSGDVYDLADCMLRQAINGPVTNSLLMLYLNHCLDSQIISFGACIMAITKIPDLKPQCMNSLLDFLIRYKTRTNCYGNDDECIALCRSLVTFVHWLHSIILSSLNELNHEFGSNLDPTNILTIDNIHWLIMDKSCQMLRFIIDSSYLKALLYIGRMEEQTVWKQCIQLHNELIMKLQQQMSQSSSSSSSSSIESIFDTIQAFQTKIEWLSNDGITNTNVKKQPHIQPLDTEITNSIIPVVYQMMTTRTEFGYIQYRPLSHHSIRIVVSFYAILDPSCSNELIANYLAIIARSFDLSLSKLYCEILHTCLVGLIDTHNLANEDRKNINYHAWIAFLLFKIPQIFLQLSHHRIKLRKEIRFQSEDQSSVVDNHHHSDLESGIDMLMDLGPCIDQFLLRYKTEHLQKLFDSFKEPQMNLLSATSVDRYMREINRMALSASNDSMQNNLYNNDTGSDQQQQQQTDSQQQSSSSSLDALSSNILIFRAEHTVTSILAPLYMENCKIEEVAGIICRMQHSFDVILCAAASNGLLPKFAQRLMELNRSNIVSRGENVRSSQIRAVIFDITFISLCSLIEQYRSDVLLESNSTNNQSDNSNSSFFINWCRWNIPSTNACYAPNVILSSYKDESKYEHLLPQLITTNDMTEFRTSLVSWDEMCIAAQFATAEILNAWIHDQITEDDVRIFIDRLKSRLCSLGLSAACWLFAKLETISAEHQSKIMMMLQELQTPSTSMINSSTESFSNDANETNLAFGYKQRFLLMSTTLKRLLTKYVPHTKLSTMNNSPTKTGTTLPIRLSKSPLNTMLDQCLHMTRKHFTLKLIYDFDGLYSLGGPRWFVTQVFRYLFNFCDKTVVCLQDSVDLAYGLFHIDLEQCALVLLRHTLPKFLLSKSNELHLTEPIISALIRLTVITTYSALEQLVKFSQFNMKKRTGHRHNYQANESLELNDNLLENTAFYYKRREHQSNSSNQNVVTNGNGNPMDVGDNPIDENSWSFSIDSDTTDYQWILKEPLYIELVHLFQFIMEQSFEYEFSPWLLVPISLMEQILLNLREDAPKFLQFISFNLLEAMIHLGHCQSPCIEQLLAYLVLDTSRSRKIGAKLICQLELVRQYVDRQRNGSHNNRNVQQRLMMTMKSKQTTSINQQSTIAINNNNQQH
ncbi:Mediator of RNA polymerase II transcription subunit 24 [Dermatophagoides farinae]|uniref:Mediator of RNA polymerase II transcription subunit 24 n=1 Tax=Dermatophagoides farinae TaxID=6954 RepID=A0A922I905_DERFA|nr:Mediator of RNA polymerase II transcription subunit 24 [Dermatophagoides farinae]